ncbi:hypothetical protein M5K25_024641 [Dendrobium thyrsiflorum]|uniref:RNase H type-1 domain-containing protein n=1 Tax=Dendrobium thyrsiflorum TaxID=117978 RepID=A0ABD0U2W7_DENTH
MKLRPRVDLFWWRLSINAIPTTEFLVYRRLLDSNECPRGCKEVENSDHIAVGCLKLIQVFNILRSWGILIPIFSSIQECILWLESNTECAPFIGNVYCSVVFLSWKSRNKFKHGANEDSLYTIASNAVSFAAASFSLNQSSEYWDSSQLLQLNSYWHPPPPEWIKLNIDASLVSNYIGGIGGVFRDHRGRFLYAWGVNCLHWDAAQLELFSIISIRNFVQDWMFECKGIIIEGDNQNIIQFVHKVFNKETVREGDLTKEDFSFLDGFNQVLFLLL